MRDLRDLLGRLAMAHKVGRHVDTGSDNGQGRPTGKVAHRGDAVRERSGDVGNLVRQIEKVAEAAAQVARLGRGGCSVGFVRVRNA